MWLYLGILRAAKKIMLMPIAEFFVPIAEF